MSLSLANQGDTRARLPPRALSPGKEKTRAFDSDGEWRSVKCCPSVIFLPQWTEIYMIYMYSVFCLSDSGYYLLLAGCDTSRYCIGVSDGDAVYASTS